MSGRPSRRVGALGLLGASLLLFVLLAAFDLLRNDSVLRGLFSYEPRTAPEEMIRRIRGGIRQPSR